MTGQDTTGTDMSTTQEISSQEQAPQPLINSEALQHPSGHPQDWDAQSCYPPEACVFVAKLVTTTPLWKPHANWVLSLSQHHDDLTLMSAVTKVFNKYGTVFVKIKRDKRQMPFGFAQYTVSHTDNHTLDS